MDSLGELDGGRSWLVVESQNEPEGEGKSKNHAVWAVNVVSGNNQIIWVYHNTG
jgi:hypothetical protein